MLLVDDHEAQVLELDVGLQELVGADDEVDLAAREPFERGLGFLAVRKRESSAMRTGKSAKRSLNVWKCCSASSVVGTRRADLLAVRQRHERGAQRDLGLAEAHVAADESIHRLARRHVLDDGLDRRGLVGCLLESESFGEGFVVVRLERERVALPRRALRVEVQELRRRVVRLLGGFLLRLFPLAAAKLVQRRVIGRSAAVAADEMQVADRHVQLGVVGVDELQELVGAVAQVEGEKTEVAADAVLFVHDGIADPHLGEVAHHRVDVAALGGFASGTAHHSCVQLAFGDERKLPFRPLEPRADRCRDEQHAFRRCEHAREPFDEMRVKAVFREVLLHGLATTRALGHDRDLVGRGFHVALERGQRIVGAAIHVHGRQRARGTAVAALHLDARERLDRAVERVRREEQLGRRQQRPRLVAAQEPVARLRVLPESLDGAAHVAVQRNDGARGQIICECCSRVEEQRQVILDAARHDAVAHVLVQRRPRRVALEHFAEAAAKARTSRFVEGELARRKQSHIAHRIKRALGVDVEGLDRLDLVVEEVDAIRQCRSHRKEIDEAAAHAELAGRDDLCHVRVARKRKLRAQCVDVERLALPQEERERGEIRRRGETVQRRGGRDDQEVAFTPRDVIERREALGDQVLVRRELIVGQRLPIGQQRDAKIGREPRHFFREPLSRSRFGAHDRDHALARCCPSGEIGERQRVRRSGKRARPHALLRIGHVVDKGGNRSRCGRFRNGRRRWIQVGNYTGGAGAILAAPWSSTAHLRISC